MPSRGLQDHLGPEISDELFRISPGRIERGLIELLSLRWRRIGIAPLPLAGLLTLTFAVFGVGEALIYQSVLLEIVLSVFLILGVAIVVARISLKSFFATGSVNVLLLGTAVLAFGTMATLGGAVSSINVNEGIAVYSIGALTAGGLHLASAILTYRGSPRRNSRLRLRAGSCYIGVIGFLSVLSLLVVESVIPAGFGQAGSIAQRGSAAATVMLLATSAVLFTRVYLRSHNSILYWYSLALWATAIGFLAFFATKGNGDLLLWTGIGSICVGSLYFLFSLLSIPRLAAGAKPRFEGAR